MIAQFRAELLKLRSTRTTLGFMLGAVLLVLLVTLLTGLLQGPSHLAGPDDQRALLGVGNLAAVFAALTGVLLVTGEYRYGTIRPTFLFNPSRIRVVAAKLAASLLAGLAVGIVSEMLSFVTGVIVLAGRMVPLELSTAQVVQLVLGTFAVAALWGTIGVGLGVIVRNQVGAVIGLLVWVFVVENLLFGLVPVVGQFAPARSGDSLIGLTAPQHSLSAWAGGTMLVAWAAALAIGGFVLIPRRDVS